MQRSVHGVAASRRFFVHQWSDNILPVSALKYCAFLSSKLWLNILRCTTTPAIRRFCWLVQTMILASSFLSTILDCLTTHSLSAYSLSYSSVTGSLLRRHKPQIERSLSQSCVRLLSFSTFKLFQLSRQLQTRKF